MTAALQQTVLTKLALAAKRRLPAYVAAQSEAAVWFDMLRDELVVELRSHVLGERLGDQMAEGPFEFDYFTPATWWQHWKMQHAGRWYARWLVKRRPAKTIQHKRTIYGRVNVERLRLFPNSSTPAWLGTETHVVVPATVQWSLRSWQADAGDVTTRLTKEAVDRRD
jgi:hypothetical protein